MTLIFRMPTHDYQTIKVTLPKQDTKAKETTGQLILLIFVGSNTRVNVFR